LRVEIGPATNVPSPTPSHVRIAVWPSATMSVFPSTLASTNFTSVQLPASRDTRWNVGTAPPWFRSRWRPPFVLVTVL
jgi:hypothetical protein